ncbi:MAG: hypothetical protein N2557_05675, partial [Hydrogenophilus sp.]|nr:hypothetical protein [Hydrogenophilus sp.]
MAITPNTPGTIVRFRNREWVVLPSAREDVYTLRPLTGLSDAVTVVHKHLADRIAYSMPEERVQPATFPLPTVEDVSNF